MTVKLGDHSSVRVTNAPFTAYEIVTYKEKKS